MKQQVCRGHGYGEDERCPFHDTLVGASKIKVGNDDGDAGGKADRV